ncbi:29053_t:CDS:2, partial [Racocetra persica]
LGPPDVFRQNASMFEIAKSIADHPNLLSMAYMIYKNKESFIKESSQEVRLRIWLEELKCLFLRTRNPSQLAIDHLVDTVLPSCKLADDEFQQLLEKFKMTFNEFCHTFNKDLRNLAHDYIKNFSNDNEYLDESTLNRFIDYGVSKKILQKYLANTRELELSEMIQNTLRRFVQAAFKLHVTHIYKENQHEFSSYKVVLEDVKNMNNITLSLDIPTHGKSDILRLYPA